MSLWNTSFYFSRMFEMYVKQITLNVLLLATSVVQVYGISYIVNFKWG